MPSQLLQKLQALAHSAQVRLESEETEEAPWFLSVQGIGEKLQAILRFEEAIRRELQHPGLELSDVEEGIEVLQDLQRARSKIIQYAARFPAPEEAFEGYMMEPFR